MTTVSRKEKKAILGKKLGMTQLFVDDGAQVPVTVLEAGPCVVLQVKTPEKDGYRSYQLGFDEHGKAAKRPQQAYLDSLGLNACRFVREVPYVSEADLIRPGKEARASGEDDAGEEGEEGAGGAPEADAEVAPGARLGAGAFRDISRVDVRGVTKGRGFSGTIKRHGFHSGDKSHGSKNVREPGSTGQHTDPARVFKGKKLPGRHGHEQRKVRNLKVVSVDEEKNLLFVRGAVPGPRGGYVFIEESLS